MSDIPRPSRLLGTVARTLAPVLLEALDDAGVNAAQRDATQAEPIQEVTRGAGVACESGGTAAGDRLRQDFDDRIRQLHRLVDLGFRGRRSPKTTQPTAPAGRIKTACKVTVSHYSSLSSPCAAVTTAICCPFRRICERRCCRKPPNSSRFACSPCAGSGASGTTAMSPIAHLPN